MSTKLTYVKTKEDAKRETRDLTENQTVKFIKHREAFKFNIGDIVVMQYSYGDGNWHTKTTGANKISTKYMYVFENEIGIGYIKQLKADGSGFTTLTTCVAELDPLNTRLILDPEFVDHILLSDTGEEFDYSRAHAERTSFRKAAIEKNKKLVIDLSTPESRINWFKSLKMGDTVYLGDKYSWNDVVDRPGKVVDLKSKNNPMDDSTVTLKRTGYNYEWTLSEIKNYRVFKSKPWPLKDDAT